EVVAELDEGDRLPREVSVLAPAGDLVVTQLGTGVAERGDLGVLIALRLPPLRGDGTDPAPAVDQRDGPADALGESPGLAALAGQAVAPGAQPADGVGDPLAGAGE